MARPATWLSLVIFLFIGKCASAQQMCANTACITTASCGGTPANRTTWQIANKTVDGITATNLLLAYLKPSDEDHSNVNCPGSNSPCHAWGPGFGDRNGVVYLSGEAASFTVQSWFVNGSLPVGPGQTPAGQCLTSSSVAHGASEPADGASVMMEPCGDSSKALHLQAVSVGNGLVQLKVLSKVPVANPLCLAVPVLAPLPPPGRPSHYFSCTANLAGGPRLPYPFCNTSLSEDERLDDLLSRATCEEKAASITSSGASIIRLGVPRLGSAEDTHGVGGGCIPAAQAANGSTGCPTTFPAGPGLGAAFDRDLWTQIGAVIGREARGLNNMRVGPLYFLDPDINLLRDPRWGRAQEVPGEDPYLTGEYGTYIIKSTQTSAMDSRYMQAASTMKHFQIYDLEGYQPNANQSGLPSDAKCDGGPTRGCGRGNFDAYPSQQDFAGYYMVAFKSVAQRSSPAAIMCAYNALRGIPACANPVNNLTARDEWGWDGFFISDCGAVAGIMGSHAYTSTQNSTIAAALNQGGVDVNCGNFYASNICPAVQDGSVSQSDVDRAARRYWRTMMRLGMFDDMESQPMVTSIGAADVDSANNRQIAQRAAAESLVLLKNDGILPLNGQDGRLEASSAKIAFIGPLANATQDLLSAPQYHGTNTLVNSHSMLQVAQRKGWDVSYSKGCNICDWVPQGYPNQPCSNGPQGGSPPLPPPNTSAIPAAVAAAKAADVAVLFLGADQTTEAENFDRVELGLVGAQEQLLAAVTAVQPNCIVVLIHGGPIAVESAVSSPAVRGIIDAFQPGELGADAVIELLEGAFSPSGRLPYTVYLKNYTKRDIREVNLRAGAGTTYLWHTEPVLFPFGYGKSYTTFSYHWSQQAPSQLSISNFTSGRVLSVNHTVVVTNTGNVTSDVVVLAFVVAVPGQSPPDMPLRRLFGFERFTAVAPGQQRTATFDSDESVLGVVDKNGVRRLMPGTLRIECGDVSHDGDGRSATHQLVMIA